jgi:hypothetical protein
MLKLSKTNRGPVNMGETQTILKKFETSARKRLKETKERLEEFLTKQGDPEPEVEISKEDDWEYS